MTDTYTVGREVMLQAAKESLRTRVKTDNGSLLFMPAYSSSLKLAVLKNVNVFPENAGRGLDTTLALIYDRAL